jgi:hypothetical protein
MNQPLCLVLGRKYNGLSCEFARGTLNDGCYQLLAEIGSCTKALDWSCTTREGGFCRFHCNNNEISEFAKYCLPTPPSAEDNYVPVEMKF